MNPSEIRKIITYVFRGVNRGADKVAIDVDRSIQRSSRETERTVTDSTRKQRRGFEALGTSASRVNRGMIRELSLYGGAAREASRETDRMTMAWNRGRRAGAGFASHLRDSNLHLARLRMNARNLGLPILVAGFTAVAQAAGAAAGGAAAIVSALRPLLGLAATIPAGLLGIAQAVGTIKAAITPVTEAVTQGINAQKSAFTSAATEANKLESASRGVADAQRAVEEAQRGVSDAMRGVADANRALDDAYRGVDEATEGVKDAQDDLNEAYRDAKEEIRDLQLAAEDAALAQRGAALSLREARQELAETQGDPSTSMLELRQAQFAVEEAEAALRRARIERRRAERESQQARRGGPERMPQVVAAQDALRDAYEGVEDALRGVEDAQRGVQDAERGVADAHRGVAEAIRNVGQANQDAAQAIGAADSATQQFRYALKQLSPAGREFARFLIDLRPKLLDLQHAAQEGLLPGVQRGMQAALKNFPVLKRVVGDTAGVFGDLAERAGRVVGREAFGRDIEKVTDSNNAAMRRLGRASINVGLGLKTIAVEARPLVRWLSQTIERFSELWLEEKRTEARTGEMRRGFADTRDTVEKLGSILGSLWGGLKNILDLARPLGDTLFDAIDRSASRFEAWTMSATGRNDLKQWFLEIEPVLMEFGRLIGDATKAVFRMSAHPGLFELINTLRVDLLPVIEELGVEFGAIFGPAIVRLLGSIIEAFAALGHPLVTFLDVLGGITETAATLIEQLPLLKTLISGLITAQLIARISNFVGNLTGINRAIDAIRSRGAAGAGGVTAAGATGVAGMAALGASPGRPLWVRVIGGTAGGTAVVAGGGGRGATPPFVPTAGQYRDPIGPETRRQAERTGMGMGRRIMTAIPIGMSAAVGTAFTKQRIQGALQRLRGPVSTAGRFLGGAALFGGIFSGLSAASGRANVPEMGGFEEFMVDWAHDFGGLLGIEIGQSTEERLAAFAKDEFRFLASGGAGLRMGENIVDRDVVARQFREAERARDLAMRGGPVAGESMASLRKAGRMNASVIYQGQRAEFERLVAREQFDPELWRGWSPKERDMARFVNRTVNAANELVVRHGINIPARAINVDPEAANRLATGLLRGIDLLKSGLLNSWDEIRNITRKNLDRIANTPGLTGDQVRKKMEQTWEAAIGSIERAMDQGRISHQEGIRRIERITEKIDLLKGRDPLGVAQGIKRSWIEGGKINRDQLKAFGEDLKSMPKDAREQTARMAIGMAQELRRKGELSKNELRTIERFFARRFGVIRTGGERQTFLMAKNMAKNMAALSNAVTAAIGTLSKNVNKALRAFGVDPVKIATDLVQGNIGGALGQAAGAGASLVTDLVGGGDRRARGGALGFNAGGFVPGSGFGDSVALMGPGMNYRVAPGEAMIANRHQQTPIEIGLAASSAMGLQPFESLDHLFSAVDKPHWAAARGGPMPMPRHFARGSAPWAGDSPAGLNPRIRSIGQSVFNSIPGAYASDTTRPYGGTFHQSGDAIDFTHQTDPAIGGPGKMRIFRFLFEKFRHAINEMYYDFSPFYLDNGGQVIQGQFGGHDDHVHAGAPGGPVEAIRGAVQRLKHVVLRGAEKMGRVGQAAQTGVSAVRAAGQRFMNRRTRTVHGNLGGGRLPKGVSYKGIDTPAEFMPFWRRINPQPGMEAFGRHFGTSIIPDESTWDPHAGGPQPGSPNPTHAGWYQFDAPTYNQYGRGGWPAGAWNPVTATEAAGNVARAEGWAGVRSRWAATFARGGRLMRRPVRRMRGMAQRFAGRMSRAFARGARPAIGAGRNAIERATITIGEATVVPGSMSGGGGGVVANALGPWRAGQPEPFHQFGMPGQIPFTPFGFDPVERFAFEERRHDRDWKRAMSAVRRATRGALSKLQERFEDFYRKIVDANARGLRGMLQRIRERIQEMRESGDKVTEEEARKINRLQRRAGMVRREQRWRRKFQDRLDDLNVGQLDAMGNRIRDQIAALQEGGVTRGERRRIQRLRQMLEEVVDSWEEQIRQLMEAATAQVERAAFRSTMADLGLERLLLEQQLAPDVVGAGGEMVDYSTTQEAELIRAQYIQQHIIPALQAQQAALEYQLAVARQAGDEALAMQIAEEIAGLQNAILQAQLDAQELIAENTEEIGDQLEQLGGTLSFEFAGQRFTDQVGAGVGA